MFFFKQIYSGVAWIKDTCEASVWGEHWNHVAFLLLTVWRLVQPIAEPRGEDLGMPAPPGFWDQPCARPKQMQMGF